MSSPKGMKREAEMYPRYRRLYESAFDRMLRTCPGWGKGKNGKEIFKWWVGDDPNQMTFDEYYEEIEEEW